MSTAIVRFNVSFRQRSSATRGFTLIELMMVVAVVGLLLGIALPSYSRVVERQKVAQAVRDIALIAGAIERYRTMHFAVPESLNDIGISMKDPWGGDYQYLSFDSKQPGAKGKVRKDHNLHPLNSEFDLYSMGPDGASSPPLTASRSHDDVIFARDGGFIGTASDY